MKALWIGYAVIVLFSLCGFFGAYASEDGRAGYQGGIMMQQVMSIVIGVCLGAIWSLVFFGFHTLKVFL